MDTDAALAAALAALVTHGTTTPEHPSTTEDAANEQQQPAGEDYAVDAPETAEPDPDTASAAAALVLAAQTAKSLSQGDPTDTCGRKQPANTTNNGHSSHSGSSHSGESTSVRDIVATVQLSEMTVAQVFDVSRLNWRTCGSTVNDVLVRAAYTGEMIVPWPLLAAAILAKHNANVYTPRSSSPLAPKGVTPQNESGNSPGRNDTSQLQPVQNKNNNNSVETPEDGPLGLGNLRNSSGEPTGSVGVNDESLSGPICDPKVCDQSSSSHFQSHVLGRLPITPILGDRSPEFAINKGPQIQRFVETPTDEKSDGINGSTTGPNGDIQSQLANSEQQQEQEQPVENEEMDSPNMTPSTPVAAELELNAMEIEDENISPDGQTKATNGKSAGEDDEDSDSDSEITGNETITHRRGIPTRKYTFESVKARLECFELDPPITLQRLCEIVLGPPSLYSYDRKRYLNSLQKVLSVGYFESASPDMITDIPETVVETDKLITDDGLRLDSNPWHDMVDDDIVERASNS